MGLLRKCILPASALILLQFLALSEGRSVESKLPFQKPTDHAKVARELVHKADWTPFGTISSEKDLNGFPMVSVISVSDSPKDGKSTGNIYFYLTQLDFPGKDVKKSNKLTMLFSDNSDLRCSTNGVDPMEPICARATISGSVVELGKNTDEYKIAKEAFHSRHPAADKWVQAHLFTLYKLDIEKVIVLDWYGGPHFITSQEYYNVKFD